MKYLVAVKKNGKNLLRFEDDKGNKIWAITTDAVVAYAKNNFKEGNECGLEYTIDDNDQYNVTRINKDSKSTKKVDSEVTKTQDTDKPVCEDCGKKLKDAKYKKCYTCNQKNPVKSKTALSTQQSIEKQNINNAVSRALISLQGHVDVNNIGGIIDSLWKKFSSKLK